MSHKAIRSTGVLSATKADERSVLVKTRDAHGCAKMWRRLTWPCRQADVRVLSRESPAEDSRRPCTRSTPYRRDTDTDW